jgi:hypothetical protein
VQIVEEYSKWLDDFQMLTGTDKDDHFDIIRKPKGETQIIAYRIKDGEKEDILFDRTFLKSETKEIWLYGLDDTDVFTVTGKPDKPIRIRIIGGQDEDTYNIQHGKNIKIYDRRSAKNTIIAKGGAQVRFTDFYEANRYNYQKEPSTNGSFSFAAGYNPDLGSVLTAGYTREAIDFIANPYSRLTEVSVQYHSITQGLDIRLKKGYAAVLADFNLVWDARFTSKNYTENFFGFGNETINPENETSFDFNRVNLSRYEGSIGFEKYTEYGSYFNGKVTLESVEAVRNGSNVLQSLAMVPFGERSYFLVPKVTYGYSNFSKAPFPAKGMDFHTSVGAIDNVDTKDFTGFALMNLEFYNALLSNNRLILKTKALAHGTLGDRPAFFQSPSLGAQNGLRGYRFNRFTGTQAFAGGADLAYNFRKMRTFFFPLNLQLYAGYDIGRVWTDSDESTVWHDSYGGGFAFQWTRAITGAASYFHSDDGNRFSFSVKLEY